MNDVPRTILLRQILCRNGYGCVCVVHEVARPPSIMVGLCAYKILSEEFIRKYRYLFHCGEEICLTQMKAGTRGNISFGLSYMP